MLGAWAQAGVLGATRTSPVLLLGIRLCHQPCLPALQPFEGPSRGPRKGPFWGSGSASCVLALVFGIQWLLDRPGGEAQGLGSWPVSENLVPRFCP